RAGYRRHRGAREGRERKGHGAGLDRFLGEAAAAAPDAVFLLTADHGMNHKSRCLDLEKICAHHGAPIRIAISVERDKYLKHHSGYGGGGWGGCNTPPEIYFVSKGPNHNDNGQKALCRTEEGQNRHPTGSPPS